MTVVSWSSFGTVVGWILYDFWIGQQEKAKLSREAEKTEDDVEPMTPLGDGDVWNTGSVPPSRPQSAHGNLSPVGHPTGASTFAAYTNVPPYGEHSLYFSPRTQQRLATVKSSILIYCAVLGLSPILKSLTKSTTSDSIWAMSSWLMCINVAFFDYGGGVGAAKYVYMSKVYWVYLQIQY